MGNPRRKKKPLPPPGCRLLAHFMEENGIGPVEAGRAIGVSHVAVLAWVDGSVPRHPLRKLVSDWTSGAVPESSWVNDDERAIVSRVVVPFQPTAEA